MPQVSSINVPWECVAEGDERPWPDTTTQVWYDPSVIIIHVSFHGGKAVLKTMESPVPAWKMKARDWLDWLRGLVGL
jgi:hypothetical protein